MPVPSAQRMKHPPARREANPLALEKLPHRRVIRHAHGLSRDLDLKMQIPNHPPQPRRHRRIPAERNLQHRLVLLRDDINRSLALENRRAIRERRLKIKTKLPPVLRHPAPPPLREREPLDGDALHGQSASPIRERALNDVHAQKRKYRCASGSTRAGSHVSTRPSAFTV